MFQHDVPSFRVEEPEVGVKVEHLKPQLLVPLKLKINADGSVILEHPSGKSVNKMLKDIQKDFLRPA